jgi:hypothetical protein
MLQGMDNAMRREALKRHTLDEQKDLCVAELRTWVADSPRVCTVDAEQHRNLWRGILTDRDFAAIRRVELEDYPEWRKRGARAGKRVIR